MGRGTPNKAKGKNVYSSIAKQSRRNIMKRYHEARRMSEKNHPLTDIQYTIQEASDSITNASEHERDPVPTDEHPPYSDDSAIVQFETQPGCSRNYDTKDEDINVSLQQKTTSDDFILTGRRIVDIRFLFKQILDGEKHELFGCDITDMDVVNEVRKGFMSTFTLKCKMCAITKLIYSEDIQNFSGTTDLMDVNSALTLGAVSSGIGYSALAEISAAINMTMMAEKTYALCHDKLADVIYSTSIKVMEVAGREEAELARSLGEVDGNGIPLITVVADGAWSKRSYNVNYNAASGVGCIVGYRTGKLLYVGVRNKFCSTCDFYHRKQLEIPEHKCFKNWSGTSTSMETDIIIEGFRSSIHTHGLKYVTLVGDGDSSVYKKLMETKPYGPQTAISKIECRNHLLRNFSSKLRDISKRTRSVSTNCSVPVYLRKEVENSSKRLRFAISKATKYRIEEKTDFSMKIELLKKDILNAPSHVFGEHAECQAINYFKCDKKGTNFVTQMKQCGLYRDIMVCLNRLILNIESLIHNMNNNLAEHYSSIVCKFVGGKRIHFSKRNSYQTRCEAAVISFNKGAEYYGILHKAITGNDSNTFTNKYINIIKKRKLRFAKLTKERKQRRQELRLKKGYALPDRDYGKIHEPIPDMEQNEFNLREVEFLNKLNKTQEEIDTIENLTKEQTSSILWLDERQKRLTASNFGKICKLKSSTSSINTIKGLLYNKFKGNNATQYGKLNEPFAIEDFETNFKHKVRKCGLFIDKEYSFLGASPDGLVDDNAILEIKCPFNIKDMSPREGILSKKIKFAKLENDCLALNRRHDYYFQVQGQLAITRKEKCYFVIWSPKGCLVEEISRDEDFWLNEMVPKLKIFFFNCLLPELVDPRITRGLQIRDNCRKGLRNVK